MKTFIDFAIAIALLVSFTIAGCNNKVETEYIQQCAGVTGGSAIDRNNSCKDCCKNNGWDDGSYWEVGQTGCECNRKN